MSSDPVATAGLVARSVRHGERNGRPTRVVIASRAYDTTPADLWDALTNPERLPRWFAPLSGDLVLGGKYQLEGNASGTIEACVEPESFAVTWVYGGSTSWVTVTITPEGEGATLELVHEAPVFPSFWKQYGPSATGIGWDLAVMTLGRHLETGDDFGPDDETAFSRTPEGAAFLEATAADWAAAAIADGDDAEEARLAADRSVAFYTPPPEESDA